MCQTTPIRPSVSTDSSVWSTALFTAQYWWYFATALRVSVPSPKVATKLRHRSKKTSRRNMPRVSTSTGGIRRPSMFLGSRRLPSMVFHAAQWFHGAENDPASASRPSETTATWFHLKTSGIWLR